MVLTLPRLNAWPPTARCQRHTDITTTNKDADADADARHASPIALLREYAETCVVTLGRRDSTMRHFVH